MQKWLAACGITLFWLLIVLLLFVWTTAATFSDISTYLVSAHYGNISYNFCLLPEINRFNANEIYLIWLMGALLTAFFLPRALANTWFPGMSRRERLTTVGISGFLGLYLLLLAGQWHYASTFLPLYWGRSLSRRNALVSDDVSTYAAIIKKDITAYENSRPRQRTDNRIADPRAIPAVSAELLTDLDLTHNPGTRLQRLLTFYLYPIDLKGIRQETPKYIITLQKKDAADHIPPTYSILTFFTNQNIVAVKNKAPEE